jgi:hypothetical protein
VIWQMVAQRLDRHAVPTLIDNAMRAEPPWS